MDSIDILTIESAGGFHHLQDLGQDATVAVFAFSGGDDKAAEYHNLLAAASSVVLTKSDLRPVVRFNPKVFRRDISTINPASEIFELSAATGAGMEPWLRWLEALMAAKRRITVTRQTDLDSTDSHFG